MLYLLFYFFRNLIILKQSAPSNTIKLGKNMSKCYLYSIQKSMISFIRQVYGLMEVFARRRVDWTDRLVNRHIPRQMMIHYTDSPCSQAVSLFKIIFHNRAHLFGYVIFWIFEFCQNFGFLRFVSLWVFWLCNILVSDFSDWMILSFVAT